MGEYTGERIQKVIASLGLASRRVAEAWIKAGRVSVNGRPAELGARLQERDQLQIDGRPVRRRESEKSASVLLCHRSPGIPLLKPEGEHAPLIASLPASAGRRFVSISPMPRVDGGLELISADGGLALRLQRAVRRLEIEYSVRVLGVLDESMQEQLRAGQLDSGARLDIRTVSSEGGEGANRWYSIVTLGASGNQLRQLLERQAVVASRILRTRLGTVSLERSLARGRTRPLNEVELASLLSSPHAALNHAPATTVVRARPRRKPGHSRRGSPDRATTGKR